MKVIVPCPEQYCNSKDNDSTKLPICIVLYTFSGHLHTHFSQPIQRPSGLQLRQQKPQDLAHGHTGSGAAGAGAPRHDWPCTSRARKQIPAHRHLPGTSRSPRSGFSSQQQYLTADTVSKGEKNTSPSLKIIHGDIKIKVAFFFIASLQMPFPDEKALLRNRSLTCYFYAHIILLSDSRAFTAGNYLPNISHCLPAWPVHFSQTQSIWASPRKHSKFKEMFPRCAAVLRSLSQGQLWRFILPKTLFQLHLTIAFM